LTNILSQAEIDELLKALGNENANSDSSADFGGGTVRNYDFRTANKFPKEQMRTINIVFDTFSQLLANRLGSVLRTACECVLLSVEEITFNEFNNSLPNPVVLAILNAPPLVGGLLFEISPEAAYMIINRLLGGTTKNNDSSKAFTEIEIALIGRVLHQCVSTFDEAWEKVLALRTQIDRIETSAQFAQFVALSEPMAVAMLEVRLGDESGFISVCLPHSAMEPVAKSLNTRLWFSGASEKRVEQQNTVIEGKLVRSKVTVSALFDDTAATVSDVVALQVGDVIRLRHKVDDPVTLKLEHITKFKAAIGTAGTNYAVQVTDIIKGEDQDDNTVAR